MTFDYCSDTHFDFYFNPSSSISKNKMDKYISAHFGNKKSDYLFIAGDIGHYPKQNVQIMNALPYDNDKIILVFGNHDYYVIGTKQKFEFKHYQHKVDYSKQLYKDNGFTVLDGDTLTVNGITIGGCDSWYDGSFFYNIPGMYGGWGQGSTPLSLWKSNMNDANLIPGLADFYDIWMKEKVKLDSLLNKCDIMVTHVKPTIQPRFMQDEYKEDKVTSFYCFDWMDKIMEDSKVKIWLYGHTHIVEEYELFGSGKKIMANPFGYPSEKDTDKLVKSFDFSL